MGESLIEFALWAFDEIFTIIIVIFLLWKGPKLWELLVLQPIQGPDKQVDMNEFAKYALVIFLGFVLYKMSPVYPTDVVLYLVLGVAGIAGIKIWLDGKKK